MKNQNNTIALVRKILSIAMIVCFAVGGVCFLAVGLKSKAFGGIFINKKASITTLYTIALIAGVVLFLLSREYEFYRKKLVALKRNTTMIPLAVLMIAFLLFSVNMTTFSDTTARILGSNMGLCQFVIMLLGMLVMVCMMNAFPKRKKANIPMLVVMFVMMGVIIFCDLHYRNEIYKSVVDPVRAMETTGQYAYIQKAYDLLLTHVILMITSAVLVVLNPVYTPLLQKIKTSVEVEGNDDMGNIEIAD